MLAGVIAAGLMVWAFAPRPVEVEIATVTRGPFRKTVDEDGKTRVRDRLTAHRPDSTARRRNRPRACKGTIQVKVFG